MAKASTQTLTNYFDSDRNSLTLQQRQEDTKQTSSTLPLNRNCRIANQTPYTLGKYITMARIGRGTFGDILRVKDTRDPDKQYALKMIKYKSSWNAGQRKKYEAMFTSEGRTIRTLNAIKTNEIGQHFIVQCKEMFNVKSQSNTIGPCIVMELCGYSLLQYMDIHSSAHLPISQQTIRYIAVQLLSAMSFMHGVGGMAHADLKPENILIHYNDINLGNRTPNQMPRIKIVDFGNVISFNRKHKSFNIQTLMYRCPEVLFENGDEMSSALDMWSIGCILFELVAVNSFRAKHERLLECRNVDKVDVIHQISHQLSRFPPYVYNTYKSCHFSHANAPELYHNVAQSYVELKGNRMRHLMKRVQHLEGNEPIALIDLLACLLDLNPLTRYSSEDAIRHRFVINKYCKQITNAHPIIKTSNDEERQTRMNEQIKQYKQRCAEEEHNPQLCAGNGYTIHRHLY